MRVAYVLSGEPVRTTMANGEEMELLLSVDISHSVGQVQTSISTLTGKPCALFKPAIVIADDPFLTRCAMQHVEVIEVIARACE